MTAQLVMWSNKEPGPREPETPAASRDAALAAHLARRADLIALATGVALELAARDGVTCAPRVLAELRARIGTLGSDTRWMGAVLLPSRGWRNTGVYVREGSRARAVPLWCRA